MIFFKIFIKEIFFMD